MNETNEVAAVMPETAAVPNPGLFGRARALLPRNKEFQRFSKFFVVGLMGAVIDFSVTRGLDVANIFETLRWQTPFGFAITEFGIVGACGFVAAVVSNFIWNRYWVYPDSRSKPIQAQIATFALINVVGLVIRTPILELLQAPLIGLAGTVLGAIGLPQLTPALIETAGKTLAWASAVVAVMLWNFFVNRYVTYNDVK